MFDSLHDPHLRSRSRVVLGLCLASMLVSIAVGDATAQSCAFYVNASDGDDSNDGSVPHPMRSLEAAFGRLSSGQSLCVAAGEYIHGADADGIDLVTGASSTELRLTPFAGRNEVRLSEDLLRVAVGNGTVRVTGVGMTLALGIGVVNVPSAFPDKTGFLHTFLLESGTLDLSEVDVRIGGSVGNPRFALPSDPARSAPADARIERTDGVLVGAPLFESATRTLRWSATAGDVDIGPELPPGSGWERIHVTSARNVTFASAMTLARDQSIRHTGSGVLTFGQGLTIEGPAAILDVADGLVVVSTVLSAVGAARSLPLVSVTTRGQLEVDRLVLPESSGLWNVSLDPGARFLASQIHTPGQTGLRVHVPDDARFEVGTETQVSAGLQVSSSARGVLSLGSDVALQDTPSTGRVLDLEGPLLLNGHVLALHSDGRAYRLDGELMAQGGRIRIEGSVDLSGGAVLPDLELVGGSSDLSGIAIQGELRVDDGAELRWHPAGPATAWGAVTVARGGTLRLAEGTEIEFLGALTVEDGAVLEGMTASFRLSADVLLLGSVSLEGSTLRIAGSDDRSFVSSAPLVLESMIIAAPLTVEAELTLTGLLQIDGGSLVLERTIRLMQGMTMADGAFRAGEITVESGGALLWENAVLDLETASFVLGESAGAWDSDTPVFVRGLVSRASSMLQSARLTVHGAFTVESGTWAVSGVLDVGGKTTIVGSATLAAGAGGRFVARDDIESAGTLNLPDATMRLDGSGIRLVALDAPVRIGSLETHGSDIQTEGVLQVTDTLRVESGSLRLTDATSVRILDLSDSTTLESAGTGLDVSGGILMNRASRLLAPSSRLLLSGQGLLPVQGPGLIDVMDLELSAASTVIRDINVLVSRSLRVEQGSSLVLDGVSVEMTGRNPGTVALVDGAIQTTRGGGIRFSGPGLDGLVPEIGGSGTLGSIRIALAHDAGMVRLRAGSRLALSGELSLRSGGLDLNGAVLDLSQAFALPVVVRDVTDVLPRVGIPDGGSIVDTAGGGAFNPSATPYSLRYTGSLAAPVSTGSELVAEGLMDLQIDAVDALNAPAVFSVSLGRSVRITGALRVSRNAVLDMRGRQIVLAGSGARHQIEGRVVSGTIRIVAEALLDAGTGPSDDRRVDQIVVESPGPVILNGFKRLGSLSLTSGHVEFTRCENDQATLIESSFTISAGTAGVYCSLSVGLSRSGGQLSVAAGSLTIGMQSRIRLGDAAVLRVEEEGSIRVAPGAVSDPGSPGGAVEFVATGSLSAPGGIAVLRIDHDPSVGVSDFVTLTGPVVVTDLLDLVDGDLIIGTHELRFESALLRVDSNGSPSDGSADSITGSQPGPGGRLTFAGPGRIELGADLVVQGADVAFEPVSESDSLVVRTLDGVSSAELRLLDGGYRHGGGTLDLAGSNLWLVGNASPALFLGGGHISGRGTPQPIALPGKTALPGVAFPFRSSDYHGIVLVGNTIRRILVTGSTTLVNLDLRSAVTLESSGASLTVSGRLAFGANGYDVDLPAVGTLRLAQGATIVRQGAGALTRAPEFVGAGTLAYDLDDGAWSGLDSGFDGDVLEAGFEQSDSASQLLILAGGSPAQPHRVALRQSLVLDSRLVIYSGILDPSTHGIHLGSNAAMALYGLDAEAPPLTAAGFSGPTSDGPVDFLVVTGAVRLTVGSSSFPPGLSVRQLLIQSGEPDKGPFDVRLPGDRTVESLRIDNRGGTVVNPQGGHLVVKQDAVLSEGSFASGTASSLVVGGTLRVGPAASIEGVVEVDVTGDLFLEGRFAGSLLSLRGNAVISGGFSAVADLEMLGSSQRLELPSGIQSVRSLLLRQISTGPIPSIDLISSSGSPTVLHVRERLSLESGLLRTNGNTLRIPGTTGGLIRTVPDGAISHVLGTLLVELPVGTAGAITFPTGSDLEYRPLTMDFSSSPVVEATEIRVTHENLAPLGSNGLPVVFDGGSLKAVEPFAWEVRSTANIGAIQSSTLRLGLPSAPATPNSGLPAAILKRSAAAAALPWNVQDGRYDWTLAPDGGWTVSVGDARDLLDATGIILAIGVDREPAPQDGWLGIIHVDPDPGAAQVDIALDGRRLAEGTGFRRAYGLTGLPSRSGGSDLRILEVTYRRSPPESTITFEIPLDLSEGDSLSLVIARSGSGSPSFSFMDWRRPAPFSPSQITFRMLQAVPDAPEVSIVRREDWETTGPFAGAGSMSDLLVSENETFTVEMVERASGSQLYAGRIVIPDLISQQVLLAFTGYLSPPPGAEASRSARLLAFTADGQVRLGATATNADDPRAIPTTFALRGNYPNPFNPSTTIVFDLPEPSDVRLQVFDALGRMVRTVNAGPMDAGTARSLRFEAEDLATGAYFYRLSAAAGRSRHVATGRFMFVR